MGLSTSIYFLDPIDRHEVFAFANSIMGNSDPDVLEDTESGENGVVTLTNQQGRIVPAWLTAEFRNHIPLCASDFYEDDVLVSPACWGELRFDTSWDYQDMYGGALELHARLVVDFHQWLTAKGVGMKWRDSDNPVVNEGGEGLGEFFDRGDKKLAWFQEYVQPKYEAMFIKNN